MAFSMSCLFKSNISFMSQFLKIIERPWKILICWHQSIMMPKYTTEQKYNFKYLSSMVCLFIPEKAQRADQDIFSCGAQELPTRLIAKKMLLMQHVTMERSHFTLCSCCTSSLCFSTLKTRTLHSSIHGKH